MLTVTGVVLSCVMESGVSQTLRGDCSVWKWEVSSCVLGGNNGNRKQGSNYLGKVATASLIYPSVVASGLGYLANSCHSDGDLNSACIRIQIH